MKQLIYISRAFVEFGPFAAKEILDFEKRGLLRDSDYVRPEGENDWAHVQTWITDSAPKLKVATVKKARSTKAKTPASKPEKPAAKKTPKKATKKTTNAKPKAKRAKKAA
jgi:hypothetical protein